MSRRAVARPCSASPSFTSQSRLHRSVDIFPARRFYLSPDPLHQHCGYAATYELSSWLNSSSTMDPDTVIVRLEGDVAIAVHRAVVSGLDLFQERL